MRKYFKIVISVIFFSVCPLLYFCPALKAVPDTPPAKPILVVYDLDSHQVDESLKLGEKIAEIFRGHAFRTKEFIMIDDVSFDEVVEEELFFPNIETDPSVVGDFSRTQYEADLAIYGSVSVNGDTMTIRIKGIKIGPNSCEVVADEVDVTDNVHEIPLFADDMLNEILGRPKEEHVPDPGEERRWKEGENLVKNGNFEKGDSHPRFWEPLREFVSYINDPVGEGKCIEFDIPLDVAWTTGVLYYSEEFPVEEDATYRFSVDSLTTGPSGKVFIKCQGIVNGKARELYRKHKNFYDTSSTEWKTFTMEFSPHHPDYAVTSAKIMLYGYLNEGKIDFDNVIVKKIKDAPKEVENDRATDKKSGK